MIWAIVFAVSFFKCSFGSFGYSGFFFFFGSAFFFSVFAIFAIFAYFTFFSISAFGSFTFLFFFGALEDSSLAVLPSSFGRRVTLDSIQSSPGSHWQNWISPAS